jgi:hypothetical protein
MGDGGRYELKYVVEETRARAIAGFLRGYLRPSMYNRPGPLPGEPVVSLYFDSPDLLFYRQASGGLKNRIKLRVRFYDDDWDHPAFLEIKRRVSDVICKDRAMISREVVRRMLREGWPSLLDGSDHSALVCGTTPAMVLQQFSYLCNAAQARATLYTTYVREAFVGADDGKLRVTFDRHIRAALYEGEDRVAVPRRGVPPNPLCIPPESVVLELKFNGGCPGWMQRMVRIFNLYRRSASKYCMCAEALGLPLGRRDVAVRQRWTVA